MNAEDPLAALRDITPPEAISWWPLAPGWWLLILLALAAVVLLSQRLWRHYRSNRYRRTAQELLKQLSDDFERHGNAQVTLAECLEILRRVARHRRDLHAALPLSGGEFITALNRLAVLPKSKQLPENTALLQQVLYAGQTESDSALKNYCEQFLAQAPRWVAVLPRDCRPLLEPSDV